MNLFPLLYEVTAMALSNSQALYLPAQPLSYAFRPSVVAARDRHACGKGAMGSQPDT